MNRPVQALLGVCLLVLFGSRRDLLTSRQAQVSGDGRDLVVLSERHRVVFIRDYERICRGETTFEQAGLVLGIDPKSMCYYLGLEHGRACVATVRISRARHVLFFMPVCRMKGSTSSLSALIFW
jgi:hypothetical protein